MKYTILGFSQTELTKFGLDLKDAMILRWFVDFYHTGKMVEVIYNGKSYAWVKYQSVIDDLPILGIKNREIIARHFAKLERCGLLEKHVKKQSGTFTCFKLLPEKYEQLISNLPKSREVNDTPDPTVDPLPDPTVDPLLYQKVDPKYSSINENPSINKNSSIKEEEADSKKTNEKQHRLQKFIASVFKMYEEKNCQPFGFHNHEKLKLLYNRFDDNGIKNISEQDIENALDKTNNIIRRWKSQGKRAFVSPGLFMKVLADEVVTSSEQTGLTDEDFVRAAEEFNRNRVGA
jgi:hypothetical protein